MWACVFLKIRAEFVENKINFSKTSILKRNNIREYITAQFLWGVVFMDQKMCA